MSQNVRRIEQIVAEEVGRLARIPTGQVTLSRSATAHGVDSLALLILRESIEQRLNVQIDDQAWLDFDLLEDLVAYVHAAAPVGEVERPLTGSSPTLGADGTGATLTADGTFAQVIEVGMPFTGLNGLAENPLLKYLGHLRWSHISAVCGVPSREVRDEAGDRLYPTFFYVDLAFPDGFDMATFGENDRIRAVARLERFGGSMLDGMVLLLPFGSTPAQDLAFATVEDAINAGVPAARLSNIFVKQFGGAEWLKKSRPANSGFERLSNAPVAPDSYAIAKAAERDGGFGRPPAGYTAITDGFLSTEYRLVPDRDLNGAGLVYFANYPLFVDIAERELLKQSRIAFSDTMLDRRSLQRRRMAYLNNASSRDTLQIELEAHLQTHTAGHERLASSAPVKLLTNARMRRKSDGRVMLVSCAEKVVSGSRLGDLPDVAKLVDVSP